MNNIGNVIGNVSQLCSSPDFGHSTSSNYCCCLRSHGGPHSIREHGATLWGYLANRVWCRVAEMGRWGGGGAGKYSQFNGRQWFPSLANASPGYDQKNRKELFGYLRAHSEFWPSHTEEHKCKSFLWIGVQCFMLLSKLVQIATRLVRQAVWMAAFLHVQICKTRICRKHAKYRSASIHYKSPFHTGHGESRDGAR